MKLSRILALTAATLALHADSYSGRDAKSDQPVMREYKENETGMMYTFSRVNLGGLNELDVFRTSYNYTDTDGNSITTRKNKNYRLQEANQFTFTYLQTLSAPDLKVFFDLDYLHADGRMHVSYPPNSAAFDVNATIASNQLFGENSTVNNASHAKISATFTSHFDLADTQIGVAKRFYRTKNIDFSVMGGVDLAFMNFTGSLNNNQYNTDVGGDIIGEADHTQSFKSRYYGAGPLAGALFQVPFNHDALRLNLKVEGSLLMGYGSAYTRHEDYTESPYGATATYSNEDDRQRHVFRMVPTLRAVLSLDVIISNLIITGGLQQAVYFDAFDMNPLFDMSEFNGDHDLSTRERLSNITTGGPFVKLSWLF